MERLKSVVLVRGHGPFPLDLLRQEHCWPASEQDSLKIATTLTGAHHAWEIRLARQGGFWREAPWRQRTFEIVQES